jgi:hypothetical protein
MSGPLVGREIAQDLRAEIIGDYRDVVFRL